MNKKVVKKMKLGKESARENLNYWLGRPVEERIAEVERLRRVRYGNPAPLQRNVVRIIKLTEKV